MRGIGTEHLCGVDDKDTMVDLIRRFLNFADELLERGVITQDTYDQITYNKKEFLEWIEKDISLNEKDFMQEKTFSDALNFYM